MSGKVLCSAYDTVADTYFPPFVAANTADAVRSFQQAVGEKEGLQNARDLILYQVGTFDNVTGRVEALKDRVQLIRGADCLAFAAHKAVSGEGQ